jgi:hypothetical protein
MDWLSDLNNKKIYTNSFKLKMFIKFSFISFAA